VTGRVAGAVTLLLIWTVLASTVLPILLADRRERRDARRRAERCAFLAVLIPARSWQWPTSPAVRVLPPGPPRRAASPSSPRRHADLATERRIS
jgi:hypothetical protein